MNGLEMAEDILRRAVSDLNTQLKEKDQVKYCDELQLMGTGCSIDSMDRVVLIEFIETELEDIMGKEIVLMDDECFKNNDETNPLNSIGKLKIYIADMLGG